MPPLSAVWLGNWIWNALIFVEKVKVCLKTQSKCRQCANLLIMQITTHTPLGWHHIFKVCICSLNFTHSIKSMKKDNTNSYAQSIPPHSFRLIMVIWKIIWETRRHFYKDIFWSVRVHFNHNSIFLFLFIENAFL